MSDHNLLTYKAEEGTEVEVQSIDLPDNFYEAHVDDRGIVRLDRNGAAFNADSYIVIREK